MALELKKPGVTLQLLHVEYRERHPDGGYGYTQFCDHYRTLGAAPAGGDAPGPPRGREALHRLRRQEAALD